MDMLKAIKSVQEQAAASWITLLNQMRIDLLLEKLAQQDINLKEALAVLDEAKQAIEHQVIAKNRGGFKGMHGFIAERLEVAIENAKKLIDGLPKNSVLIDDNGPVDYTKNGIPIQQKVVQYNLGLKAIKAHLEKYPDFLKNGGEYEIPKDFYERLKALWDLSAEDAGKLQKEEYRIWNAIQEFKKQTGVSLKDIKPMETNYGDNQQGTYKKTVEKKKEEIKERDKEKRDKAYQESKPSLKEAGKAAGVSAAVEGGLGFCMSIAKKRKEGKKIGEYSAEDWKEVGIDTGKSTLKGGVRGATVYVLTNFTCTPANVASALVTATFGIVSNSARFARGDLSQEDFLINSEACCMEAGISALSAILGELVIPVPVLGAVVGTAVGNFMYGIAKQYCDENAKKCIEQYYSEINALNEKLEEKYRQFVEKIEYEFQKYKSIFELAFDRDVNVAFSNSILLAQMSGVEDSKILKTKKDIDNYFLA